MIKVYVYGLDIKDPDDASKILARIVQALGKGFDVEATKDYHPDGVMIISSVGTQRLKTEHGAEVFSARNLVILGSPLQDPEGVWLVRQGLNVPRVEYLGNARQRDELLETVSAAVARS